MQNQGMLKQTTTATMEGTRRGEERTRQRTNGRSWRGFK